MRDFRDAKVMARALRDALKAKAIETSHSDCLELVAKAFDCEDWNILAAKIDAAREAPALATAEASGPAVRELHCSFCGASQHKVLKLIAGPSVFICDACVGLCDTILENETVFDLFAGRRHVSGHDEDLAANVERARKHVGHWRSTLQQIEQTLVDRDRGLTDGDAVAQLKDKSTADLVDLKERYERALARYETASAERAVQG